MGFFNANNGYSLNLFEIVVHGKWKLVLWVCFIHPSVAMDIVKYDLLGGTDYGSIAKYALERNCFWTSRKTAFNFFCCSLRRVVQL